MIVAYLRVSLLAADDTTIPPPAIKEIQKFLKLIEGQVTVRLAKFSISRPPDSNQIDGAMPG